MSEQKDRLYECVERAEAFSYTSAVLANEINISQEGLRYYEKKGAGKAVRVEENGYRKYHPQEVVVLRMIRMMTAYGFSLNEAIELVTSLDFTQEQFREELCKKEKILEDKIKYEQLVLARLREGITDLSHIEEDKGLLPAIWFEHKSAFCYLHYKTGLYAKKNKNLSALMQRWMQLMPVAYPMTLLRLEDYKAGGDPLIGGGIVIDEENLPDDSYLHARYCRRYPARDYLCTTSCQTRPEGVTINEPQLQHALGQIRAMRLEVDGDIFFKSVSAREREGSIRVDYKVMIPVKPMS